MAKCTYITHFNTKIKQSDANFLTRENYCILTTKPSYKVRKNLEMAQRHFELNKCYPTAMPDTYYKFPNNVFADKEHYTEEHAKRHYDDCMKNFDLNMKFFSSLDTKKFNKHLTSFVKRNRFKEITDLQTVSQIEGIYILVLDKYNQVYIGISSNIKKRILSHWTKRKEFDRLIFGGVETSILSIDSFGALDTTRIFYKPCSYWQIDEYEKKYIAKFKNIYRLNRVCGGINEEKDATLRNLIILANVEKRDLTQ